MTANNRSEMHKFFERLLEGKDPAEALATLKEIMIEYFGFGSSIELEELALILGQIADDYNEDQPDLEEDEEDEVEEKGEVQDQLDILKKEIERIKREQGPTPFPINPAPYTPPPKVPQPWTDIPAQQPYRKQPWVGDPTPGDFEVDPNRYKYTMRSDGAKHLKSSVDVTPELFQEYVSSLSSSSKQ